MPKYTSIKVRDVLVVMLKRCQRPHEPLSDTLKAVLDPIRVYEREAEARVRDLDKVKDIPPVPTVNPDRYKRGVKEGGA